MIVGITVLSLIILIATFFLGYKAGYKANMQETSEELENPYLATTLKFRAVEEATIQEFRIVDEGEHESKFKPGDRVKFNQDFYKAIFGDESNGIIIDCDKDTKIYEVNVTVKNNGRIIATLKNYFPESEMIKIETEQPEEVNNE